MNWHLKLYTNHKGAHCEVCGTEITHIWWITNGELTLRVGTECMGQYLMNTKKLFKQVTMAQAIYRKAMNYGDSFRSFWIDYYVNATLTNSTVSKSIHYVWTHYWLPYHPEDPAHVRSAQVPT